MRDIPAIPTKYEGIEYRSRLEARWACMFSLLGWKANYEPFEQAGWLPDFVISDWPGAGNVGALLVEVKPSVYVDEALVTKLESAAATTAAILLVTEAPTKDIFGRLALWVDGSWNWADCSIPGMGVVSDKEIDVKTLWIAAGNEIQRIRTWGKQQASIDSKKTGTSHAQESQESRALRVQKLQQAVLQGAARFDAARAAKLARSGRLPAEEMRGREEVGWFQQEGLEYLGQGYWLDPCTGHRLNVAQARELLERLRIDPQYLAQRQVWRKADKYKRLCAKGKVSTLISIAIDKDNATVITPMEYYVGNNSYTTSMVDIQAPIGFNSVGFDYLPKVRIYSDKEVQKGAPKAFALATTAQEACSALYAELDTAYGDKLKDAEDLSASIAGMEELMNQQRREENAGLLKSHREQLEAQFIATQGASAFAQYVASLTANPEAAALNSKSEAL